MVFPLQVSKSNQPSFSLSNNVDDTKHIIKRYSVPLFVIHCINDTLHDKAKTNSSIFFKKCITKLNLIEMHTVSSINKGMHKNCFLAIGHLKNFNANASHHTIV
jgi:hypothetical protein